MFHTLIYTSSYCHEVFDLFSSKIVLQKSKNFFNSSSQYPAIHCREGVSEPRCTSTFSDQTLIKQSIALFKEDFNFDHGNEGLNSQVNKSGADKTKFRYFLAKESWP